MPLLPPKKLKQTRHVHVQLARPNLCASLAVNLGVLSLAFMLLLIFGILGVRQVHKPSCSPTCFDAGSPPCPSLGPGCFGAACSPGSPHLN